MQRRAPAEAQLNTVQALSDILNTGLDRTTLSLLVQLLEAGVNPEVMLPCASRASLCRMSDGNAQFASATRR